MSRLVWLTKGPKAGSFVHFGEARAKAIVAAGMGQDVEGLADRNLLPAEVTDDEYPDVTPGRRKTYKRRDLRAEG